MKYYYDWKKYSHKELEKIYKWNQKSDEEDQDERIKKKLKLVEGEKILDVIEHFFARSRPIIIPFFGKKIKIIGMNLRILNKFPSLKTMLVFKAKKR